MYFVGDQLVITTTGASSNAVVRTAVRTIDDGRHFRRVAAADARGTVQYRTVAFDYPALRGWARSASAVLTDPGVVTLGIIARTNSIQIGVATAGDVTKVTATLNGLGIPAAAVDLQIVGSVSDQTDLDDKIRPFPGGVIVNDDCTVGAIVEARESDDGFLTASHCTNIFGGNGDGTNFYQHENIRGQTNHVGNETADGDLYQYGSGAACPSPLWCRYSDAAFISLDDTTDDYYGAIARTTGYGSTTISSSTPRFLLNEPALTAPIEGDTVHIMGAVSGWLRGEVLDECSWLAGPGANQRRLCMMVADYNSDNGDSGAPVFTWDGSSTYVDLVGIHAARIASLDIAFFSRWLYVDLELNDKIGTLNVAY